MKSIFKVRRITLKGIESKTEQHFLSFDQAPPAVNKQMSSALASLPVCLAGELQQVCLQVLVQPWLSLSCWAALGSHPWPELPLHPLPSLGHTCLSLGQGRLLAELGLQEGPPQLGSSKGVAAPSLHVWCVSLWCAGSWRVPHPRLCDLGAGLCTAQSPLWPVTDETRSHCFSQQFLRHPLQSHKRPPALLRSTYMLSLRRRLSRDGLCLCLALSHTVFLLSATLMVCTVKPCVFSPGRGQGELQ